MHQLKEFGSKYNIQSDFDEGVNLVIREHIEQLPGDWEYQDFVETMLNWSHIINEELYDRELPTPLIGMRRLQKNRLADYLPDRNEFAINFQIRFNTLLINDLPLWQQIMILTHELGHLWQHLEGEAPKSRTHNAEFLQKLADFGIITNKQGWTAEIRKGKFTEMLDLKGVEYSLNDPLPIRQSRIPKVVWSCICENFMVRIDVEEDASSLHCTICNSDFAAKEKKAKPATEEEEIEDEVEDEIEIEEEIEDILPLEDMSKAALKQMLDDFGIKVGRASKAVMITAINEYNNIQVTESVESESESLTQDQLGNESVKELKVRAKDLGLKISGSKSQLIVRIFEHYNSDDIDIEIEEINIEVDDAESVPDKPDEIENAIVAWSEEKDVWVFVCSSEGCGKTLSRAAGVKTHWRKKHAPKGTSLMPVGALLDF